MKNLKDLFTELGMSKVKLAKYLVGSRQMLYNYLAEDDLDKWPKEKAIKLFSLLGIKDKNEIKNIKIDSDYISQVESRLKDGLNEDNGNSVIKGVDLKNLSKKEQEVLSNIINLLTEKIVNDKTKDTYNAYRYLYYFLQSMDQQKELEYMLGYIAKSLRFVEPNEFVFNENKQFIFESIMFSAMTLYNNGGASKARIAETHKRFVQELEQKKEEFLSRTQELNTAKIQALKELGYTEINDDNAKEVLDKIAEIESRRV
jgi:hypothetical protein